MKRLSLALSALALFVCGAALAAQKPAVKPLEIYVIDVEGGKSDLWLTPAGEAVLIDTASPGERDINRIMDVINAAGVKKIDHMITTHYHVDHAGALAELSKRIPIVHFYDHGETIETGVNGAQKEQIPGFWALYPSIYGKGTRTSVKPGDRIPVTGLDWRVVTAGGQVLKTPLPGAGKPNPYCAGTTRRTVTLDPEDGQSIGSVVSYGKFRALDFGDMTWDIEHDLMCPNNPIGTVDMYFVSDHGLPDNTSKEFVHAIQPRVAVVQNSARKGNSLVVLEQLRSAPGFEDLWQLHWGNAAGLEWNSPGLMIANGTDAADVVPVLAPPPAPPAPAGAPAGARAGGGGRGPALPPHSPAYSIKITVQADGTYTVTNMRNNFSKTYAPKAR